MSNSPNGNRLGNEKSPYLLQHADNPVNWFAWGDEAFEVARRENKPVFLSIGYSTCHWCHVMAHESFEDARVAELMNEHVIAVKIDREERPDLDQQYMAVCQMMTGSGGWPLTVVLTPDKRPFFAGTYFPKASRFGRIGMVDLIPRIHEAWMTQQEKIDASATEILSALSSMQAAHSGDGPQSIEIRRAVDTLMDSYDETNGGFGQAPKFPSPHNLMFLLDIGVSRQDPDACRMARHSLDAMAAGGVFDHVGGGFHRYSTDASWTLPHFEKMLYDQAMLCLAYTTAYQATGDKSLRKVATRTLDYVAEHLLDGQGGFYSAEDADSEGEEGRFYLWELAEVDMVLGREQGELFAKAFGILEEGNFEDEASGRRTGSNVLHRVISDTRLSEESGLDGGQTQHIIANALESLRIHREKRTRPHLDDKILTDWNGLMIAACAKAGVVFDEPRYTEMAGRAMEFVRRKLVTADGSLMHRYRDGEAAIAGMLDDYAFLIWALIELHQATFDPGYLEDAIKLQDRQISLFGDAETGGFFQTDAANPDVLLRSKDAYDGAIPSGNSVSMHNLLRLAGLTGRNDYLDLADRAYRAFSPRIQQSPASFCHFLAAANLALGGSSEIVIAAHAKASSVTEILRRVRKRHLPGVVTHLLTPENRRMVAKLAPWLEEMQPNPEDDFRIFTCKSKVCTFPTSDLALFVEFLEGGRCV